DQENARRDDRPERERMREHAPVGRHEGRRLEGDRWPEEGAAQPRADEEGGPQESEEEPDEARPSGTLPLSEVEAGQPEEEEERADEVQSVRDDPLGRRGDGARSLRPRMDQHVRRDQQPAQGDGHPAPADQASLRHSHSSANPEAGWGEDLATGVIPYRRPSWVRSPGSGALGVVRDRRR